MKILLAFLVGMLIGLSGFIGYLYLDNKNTTQVLSQKIEVHPSPSLEPEVQESPDPETPPPSIEPVKTVQPSPVVSLKPSPKPSPKTSPPPLPSPVASTAPTPTPNPTATPDVWSPPAMEPLFAQYAGQYNVDKNTLERIANCESHFNPNAQNGIYLGMFQFAPSSWTTNRNLMGLDPNPTLRSNIEESIKTAAFLLSRSGTSPWPSCV